MATGTVQRKHLTFPTHKDAHCFALEAKAIVAAAVEEIASNEMEGVQGLLNRVSADVEDAMSASEVVRGQICNELRAVQRLICRINEDADTSLLYAAESMINLTVASLQTCEEVQHG